MMTEEALVFTTLDDLEEVLSGIAGFLTVPLSSSSARCENFLSGMMGRLHRLLMLMSWGGVDIGASRLSS